MTFDLTADQHDFATTLRAFFEDEYSTDRLRAVVDDERGYDMAFWKSMTTDLGLSGLSVPDDRDGVGGGEVELAILWEEYGRALVSSPLLATLGLAVPALLHAGTDEARTTWLPRLASGSATATWAVLAPRGEPDLQGVGVRAGRTADGWILTGQRLWVLDGATADVVLTTAQTDEGVALFAVEPANAAGIVRTSTARLDPTLALGQIEFDASPAVLLSRGDATAGLERALAVARVGLAALQVGCLSGILDMAVSYAKTRVQFGRPIGGFQSIKHRCSDIFIDTETSRWVAYHAAAVAADPATATPALVDESHLTASYVSDASIRGAAHLLQILGGIGYTWEHAGHLYFKRAAAAAKLLGSTRAHLDVIAEAIDRTPAPTPSPPHHPPSGSTHPRSAP